MTFHLQPIFISGFHPWKASASPSNFKLIFRLVIISELLENHACSLHFLHAPLPWVGLHNSLQVWLTLLSLYYLYMLFVSPLTLSVVMPDLFDCAYFLKLKKAFDSLFFEQLNSSPDLLILLYIYILGQSECFLPATFIQMSYSQPTKFILALHFSQFTIFPSNLSQFVWNFYLIIRYLCVAPVIHVILLLHGT